MAEFIEIVSVLITAALLGSFFVFGTLFFLHGALYYQRLNREAKRREERMKKRMEEPIQYIPPTDPDEVLRIKNQASLVMNTGPYSTMTGRKPGEPQPQWGKPADPEEMEKLRESLQSGRIFVPAEPFTVSRKDIEEVPGDIRAELYQQQLAALRRYTKSEKTEESEEIEGVEWEGETIVTFADNMSVATYPVEILDGEGTILKNIHDEEQKNG